MTTDASNTLRRRPWYRKAAMIVLFPFVLPTIPLAFFVIVCFGAYAVAANYYFVLGIRRHMRRRGRYVPSSEICERIAAHGGTLIIESPSLGWTFTHAWWTPDDVVSISPFAIPADEEYKNAAATMRCLDWDKWCWDNYTSPDEGRALLLRVWNGASVERRLRQRFADLSVVRTWTAFVHVGEPPQGFVPARRNDRVHARRRSRPG